MVDARPARRALLIFALALSLTATELAWWMVLNLRGASAQRSDRVALLERDAALATRLYNSGDAATSTAGEAWLSRHFPKLRWQCESDGQACRALPRPEALAALDARFRTAQRMFVAEGAFLFAMLVLGASVMLRAMRREVAMVRQQANFLAAVTHELKSPLASIRLAVETLKRRPPTAAVLARYLDTLLNEAVRLEGLVNNVLMASRLGAPRPRLVAPRALAPIDVVCELNQLLDQIHDERRQLRTSVPQAPLYVAIDGHDLRTIARNLIDNALKYARDSHDIVVRLVAEPHEVRLEVADDGPGLSPASQRRVFDKFFRVGDELSRSHEGSGLGLFLVRALAEAAGGEAHVYSEGKDHGALFWVTLPRVSAAAEGQSGAA